MTILLTGSNGKTATHLATLLSPTHQILIASRNPPPNPTHPTTRFNWLDPSTYTLPFFHPLTQTSPISAIYLVSPDVPEARASVMEFVKFAVERGVKRFVLLSAWENAEGGAFMGRAHGELKALGDEGMLEWAVLRPHFFMENFIEGYHLASIKNKGKIYTGAGDGHKPFIAAQDIAAVARRALIDEKSHGTDHYITGPESLTYDDVAETLTEVLGKKIEHVKLSKDGFEKKLVQLGFAPDFSAYMADLDFRISQGLGKETTDVVLEVTGQPPKKFKEWAIEHRNEWV